MRLIVLSVFYFIAYGLFSQDNTNEILQIAQKREACIERMQPYPNPSSGIIHLDAPEGSICHVVNFNGQIIGSYSILENGLYKDNLESGSYIIVIQYGTETFRRKFVVL